MPYVISRPPRRALALFAACLGLLVGMLGMTADRAAAGGIACSPPSLTQAFLGFGDRNYYVMAPGEAPDSFTGAGWTLSGGASVIPDAMLFDGTNGAILDLPSGSKAVSPEMCVNSSYATARTMVRNVVGGEGVQFYVSYLGTPTWTNPQNTGQVHGAGNAWTLSGRVNVQPGNASGWEVARFTFIPGGNTSDFQIYNFYVDPYSR